MYKDVLIGVGVVVLTAIVLLPTLLLCALIAIFSGAV